MIHGLSSQGEPGTRREKASHATGSYFNIYSTCKEQSVQGWRKG